MVNMYSEFNIRDRMSGVVKEFDRTSGSGMVGTELFGDVEICFKGVRDGHSERIVEGAYVLGILNGTDSNSFRFADVVVPFYQSGDSFDFDMDVLEEMSDVWFVADVYVGWIKRFRSADWYGELKDVFDDEVVDLLFRNSTFIEICEDDMAYASSYDESYWSDHVMQEFLNTVDLDALLKNVRDGVIVRIDQKGNN